MHFLRTCIAQHLHNEVAGRTADDGIVDHDDAFSCDCLFQHIQFYFYRRNTAALFRLDEGTSHIRVLHKRRSVWDSRLHRIAKCCSITGFRHTDHEIGIDRGIDRQTAACVNAGMINAHTVKHTIRSCKVNIFKDTSCLFLRIRQAHALIGVDSVLGDRYDLTRLHIADKFRVNRCQGAALGCQDIGIFLFADTKRLKAKWISRTDHLARAHDDQRIRTLDLLHGICHRRFNGCRAHTLTCDMVRNDL